MNRNRAYKIAPAAHAAPVAQQQMDFDGLTNQITIDVSRQVLRLAWLHNHDEIEVGLIALINALCRLIRRCPHPDQRAALAAEAIDKLRVFHIKWPFEDVRIVENPSIMLN